MPGDSELKVTLRAHVDRLWVTCVSCPLSERQAVWDRGLVALKVLAGTDHEHPEIAEALQDLGYRLGISGANVQTARLFSSRRGEVKR